MDTLDQGMNNSKVLEKKTTSSSPTETQLNYLENVELIRNL